MPVYYQGTPTKKNHNALAKGKQIKPNKVTNYFHASSSPALVKGNEWEKKKKRLLEANNRV